MSDKKQTAVEWLKEELTYTSYFNGERYLKFTEDTDLLVFFIEAKEIEDSMMAEMNKEIERLKSEIPKWISVEDNLPPYGENVFAICEELHGVQVMALCEMFDNNNKPCIVWCNAYQNLEGDAEFDDNYNVTDWMPLIKIP